MVDELDQTQKLPDCLPPATAVAAILAARDFGAAMTGAIYCASPSGAFVDGTPTM